MQLEEIKQTRYSSITGTKRKSKMQTYSPQELQLVIGGVEFNGCTIIGFPDGAFSVERFNVPKKWFKVIEANEKTTKLELEDNNFTVATIELYNSSESLQKILNSEATEKSPFKLSVNNLPV